MSVALTGLIHDQTTAGSITKVGAGTLILSGDNTYTGGTTVSSGTLDLEGANDTSGVTIGNGTLEIASGGSAGTGPIVFDSASAVLKVDSAPSPTPFANTLSDVAVGDEIDLHELTFKRGPLPTATVSGSTLTVTNGSQTETFILSVPGTTTFTTAEEIGGDGTLVTAVPTPAQSAGGGSGGGGTTVGTPTATAETITTTENTADPITLTGTDPDSPALALTYAITTQPTDGTLSNFNSATGAVTYTPNAGYVGPDSFAFTDSNGTNTSAPATVGVAVTPPPTNNVTTTLPPPAIAFDPTVTTLGSAVTLTGTVAAATGATVAGVELFLGTKDIGAATLNGDGTWTYDFDQKKGFHTGITAVATDSQGLQTSAPSDYDLTTGVTGEPYRVIQDRYDASADFLGQTFFKPSGVVYLKSTYAALPDGGSSYTYKGGSFFDGKDYTSFTDNLTANGNLTTHIEYDKDGSHAQEIDANKQTVTALGNDTFADYASSTRFVFGMNDGEEAIYGFKATGADHDTLQLSSARGR